METTVQIGEELLKAISGSDVKAIIQIVTDMTPRQKTSIREGVFNNALESLLRSQEPDPVVFSDSILTFLLAVGRFTSPAVVCLAVNALPLAPHKNKTGYFQASA